MDYLFKSVISLMRYVLAGRLITTEFLQTDRSTEKNDILV